MSDKKIITPDNDPTAAPKTAAPPESLTREKCARLAHAIRRLHILEGQTVATAQRDAEIRGIKALLLSEMTKYAHEFVGSWFVLHDEYDPLCESLARLFNRAGQINSERYARMHKAQQEATNAEAVDA